MGHFGHENGLFWMLAGAVLVLFFFHWGRFGRAVLVCVGCFRPSLGPFWRWAVLVGSHMVHWALMGGLLHLVQRGGDWVGPQPAQALERRTVPNVTARPSSVSVPTSYYRRSTIIAFGV